MCVLKNPVFVFVEQRKGKIHPVSYELLGKGRELANKLEVELVAGVFGEIGLNVNELIYCGADTVYYCIDEKLFSQPEEMVYTHNIVKLLKDIEAQVCLFGATSFGRSLAPRVAASLSAGLTADCTGLDIDEDGNLVQIRPAFSENILAHIKSKTKPQMATVRYKEFNEATRDIHKKGKVVTYNGEQAQNNYVKIIGEIISEEFDITAAEVVVSAGKGLKAPEDMKLIKELADVLGGAVGTSRPLVEEGYVTKPHQVGYSGNRVKPKLYIACGISGAAQHLAGMHESEFVMAINSDASAPIFKIADYGIVGDMYEIIPQLIKKLKPIRNKVF